MLMDLVMSTAADNWPYSAREAAAHLGISERTIRRAIARGELAATKRAGVFRITLEALTAYGYQRRHSSPPRKPGRGRQPERFPEPSAALPLLHFVKRADSSAFDVPRPLTPFLGRDREIATVVATLGQPEIRLLSRASPSASERKSPPVHDPGTGLLPSHLLSAASRSALAVEPPCVF